MPENSPTNSIVKGLTTGAVTGTAASFIFPPVTVPIALATGLIHAFADWNLRDQERLDIESDSLDLHNRSHQIDVARFKNELSRNEIEKERNSIFRQMNEVQMQRNMISQQTNNAILIAGITIATSLFIGLSLIGTSIILAVGLKLFFG